MFIITLSYKKPLNIVDKYLQEHREYLEQGYQKNYFVASGPKIPRTGGLIISCLKNREQLEEVLKNDPFSLNDVAEYEIVEFEPAKYHEQFNFFVNL